MSGSQSEQKPEAQAPEPRAFRSNFRRGFGLLAESNLRTEQMKKIDGIVVAGIRRRVGMFGKCGRFVLYSTPSSSSVTS
jgi:hypothetical protein